MDTQNICHREKIRSWMFVTHYKDKDLKLSTSAPQGAVDEGELPELLLFVLVLFVVQRA